MSVARTSDATQKMKFSIREFFSKCDQIRRKLRVWSHLLKKFLMENFIFCEVSHSLFNDEVNHQQFHLYKIKRNKCINIQFPNYLKLTIQTTADYGWNTPYR